MMHPTWPSAIALCTATLLVSITLGGCDDSGADTAAPLTQATAGTSPPIDATPVAPDTAPQPPTSSDPMPPAVSAEPTANVVTNDASPPPVAKTRTPKSPRIPSAKPVNVTFDDIKLDLEKDEPYVAAKRTARLEELDGERVRIRGFILPGYQQSGLTQFVLVRDNMECCFGPGAALFDCIVVEMEGDATAEFSVRPVTVEGVFEVQELKDFDGRQLAIYHLAGEDVR